MAKNKSNKLVFVRWLSSIESKRVRRAALRLYFDLMSIGAYRNKTALSPYKARELVMRAFSEGK